LPLSDIELSFSGSAWALIANPQTCGPATTTSELVPWSAGQDAMPSSSFDVTWEGAGERCAGPPPFAPSLSAGTTIATAGSFSPLSLTVSSHTPEQSLSRLGFQPPPGLEWMFSSVPLCGEPQAREGTCSSASQIGTATIVSGPGPYGDALAGVVYLTQGYDSGQYGLSIAIHAVIGTPPTPFNLGDVVIRAAIGVNPVTGALSIADDPLPLVLDGIALRTQTFNMTIDRPELILNPTICASRQITATIEGAQGTVVQVSDPFGNPGCQNRPAARATEGSLTGTEKEETGTEKEETGTEKEETGTEKEETGTEEEETTGSSGSANSSPKPTPKLLLSHISEKVSGNHLLLTLTAAASGLMTITGKGIGKYTKKIRAGAHKFEITLSKSDIFDWRNHLRLELELTFRIANGSMGQKVTIKLWEVLDSRPSPRADCSVGLCHCGCLG
jgi:hypothetical protein